MKESIKQKLEEAEEKGADLRELRQLKAMLTIGTPRATKKYKTPEKRKAERKAQKNSRRRNRRN